MHLNMMVVSWLWFLYIRTVCVCVESCLPPVTDLALQRKSQEVVNQQRSRAANLTPIDKLKEKATAAAMKKQYNVFDYYRHSK